MNAAAGFIPRPERAGFDILAHAFFRATEKREFPIVNRACAVGGEVCDPTLFHQFDDDALRAVLHEVRPVHEDDAGVALARGADAVNGNAYLNIAFRKVRRSVAGCGEKFIERTKTAPSGERLDFDPFLIERSGKLSHCATGLNLG